MKVISSPAAVLAGVAALATAMHAGETASSTQDQGPAVAISDPQEQVAVLEMLATQIRGNYDRIRTWSGRFRFEDQLRAEAAWVQALMSNVEAPITPPLVRVYTGGGEFRLEMESDSLYSTFEVDGPPTITELKTGRTLPSDHLKNQVQYSVVTPEQYLHIMPEETYRNIRGNPEATARDREPKRAAFKDSPEKARRRAWADIIDPRAYFGTPVRPFWKEFSLYVGSLRSGRPTIREMLRIRRLGSEGEPIYEVALTWGKETKRIHHALLDSKVGFNPIRWEQRTEDGRLEQEMVWEWKQVDGIYVFDKIRRTEWTSDGEAIKFQRVLDFSDHEVNGGMEPKTFTEAQFQLAEGEKLVDRVADEVYVVDQGKLTPMEEAGSAPIWRLPLVLGIGAVLFVAIILLLRRQRGARRSGSAVTAGPT